MKYQLLAPAFTAALLISGCTTSLTTQPEAPGYATAVQRGIPYRLPMAQIDLNLDWRLSGCETWTITKNASGTKISGVGADGDALAPVSEAELRRREDFQIKFASAATHKIEIVEGESFLIDYDRLTNSFKKGKLEVTYHENTLMLKTINSTIEGMEAEAVGNAIKLGANVARIATGLPPGTVGGSVQVDRNSVTILSACTQAARDMIAAYDKYEAQMEEIPAKAQLIKDRLEILRLRATEGELSAKDKKERDDLYAAYDALEQKKADLKTGLDAIANRLTVSGSWRFPDKIDLQSDRLAPVKAKADKWLKPLLTSDAYDRIFRTDEQYEAFRDTIAIDASMKPLLTQYACVPSTDGRCAAASTSPGVLFRQPVQARLVVAYRNEKPMVAETIMVPQFGRLRLLPLESDWGEKNTLSAEFASNGVPTKVTYEVFEAPGVKAIALGNDAAAAFLSLRSERRAQQEAEETAQVDREKAEIDGLKRQIELLEQQTKLENLQTAAPTTISELNAELALLRLQKEKSDLEAAIRANNPK